MEWMTNDRMKILLNGNGRMEGMEWKEWMEWKWTDQQRNGSIQWREWKNGMDRSGPNRITGMDDLNGNGAEWSLRS